MTTVATDNCQLCRLTDCVTACPVACFHGDDKVLYIDPVAGIDCGAVRIETCGGGNLRGSDPH